MNLNKDPLSDVTLAVVYCRVSSTKQTTEGSGLSSQETRCREYCHYQKLQVVKVFQDDMSGSVISRPGMKAMLEYLKRNRKIPHAVVIDDVSRLARGIEAHLKLRAAIINAGGILVSPNITFSNDSHSILHENLMASVSQFQREANGEQTRNRMRARMQAGFWAFKAPVGFKFGKTSEHRRVLVRDEPVASAIEEIYEGYASGRFETLTEVMRYIENCNVWPQSQRKNINVQRVTEILTRPHYAGYINAPEWGIHMVKGVHEPIISFGTYQRVQERRNERARAPARSDVNEAFPLRGFVTCADCGSHMTAGWAKGRSSYHPYYLCQKKGCASYGKSVRRDVIEGQFEELLKSMCPTHELFELATEMFKDAWDAKLDSRKANKNSLDVETKRIQKQMDSLVERIIETDSPTLIGAYEKKLRDLEISKAEIADKISNCGRPIRSFEDTYRTAMSFLENPYKIWLSDRLVDKRAVLKLAFASHLPFSRIDGFRTAQMSLPFNVFNDLSDSFGGENKMVGVTGIEPVTPTMSM